MIVPLNDCILEYLVMDTIRRDMTLLLSGVHHLVQYINVLELVENMFLN